MLYPPSSRWSVSIQVCGWFTPTRQNCEFTDKLEEMLRDLFIIGINDDSILWKLRTESDPNLAKVMEIATECKQTTESLRVISNRSKVIQQDPSVNKVNFGCKQKCFSKPPNSPPPPEISESTRKVRVTCWCCSDSAWRMTSPLKPRLVTNNQT